VPFAAALSSHPVAATAIGEIVGQVLDRVGPEPDLAVLFATAPHTGALEDVVATVEALLRPHAFVGCTAESVAGGSIEVERAAALTLWAGRFGPVAPVRLERAEVPPDPPFDPTALLLLADPFTFPAPQLFELLAERYPGVPVIGGNASAARGPGGNRLILNGAIDTDGAVGAFLGPGVTVTPVTSQGCRPIGSPFVITRAEQNVIFELGGRPAMERLMELVPSLDEAEVQLINRGGLHVGRVVDERKVEVERGDLLTMNVIGASKEEGAIAVGALVDIGMTVQFQLRDAASASEDLERLLRSGHDRAEAALLFSCNGRGTRLFPEPHHDASAIQEWAGALPMSGIFAAGEFGPIGGHNFVHGFTASVALFTTR
jgi:small ligand-binding sensory domain FIST